MAVFALEEMCALAHFPNSGVSSGADLSASPRPARYSVDKRTVLRKSVQTVDNRRKQSMANPDETALERYLLMNDWNKLLLEKGSISRKAYPQMATQIQTRYPVA